MKKVLAIYFTQSGQLEEALKATLEPLENSNEVDLHYEQIKPVNPFPYPWKYSEFFDAFPETVHGVPCEIEPISFNPKENYDIVILAYQPWYLSVNIPINSFLQSEAAKQVLNGKKVITIIACRNMWLNAQEKMKQFLKNLNAELVGNITYVDKSNNLISLVTVLAFVLKGIKKNFLGIFPKYGVSDKDLQSMAPQCGSIIFDHLKNNEYSELQNNLVAIGAVAVKPSLMLLEKRGKVLFPMYANYISKRGNAGSKERKTRVKIFGIVLPLAILILSPVITITSRLAPLLFRNKLQKEKDYYSGTSLS